MSNSIINILKKGNCERERESVLKYTNKLNTFSQSCYLILFVFPLLITPLPNTINNIIYVSPIINDTYQCCT